MSLAARDVAGYFDPSEVPGTVKLLTIGGYLAAVVATVVIYDTGMYESTPETPFLTSACFSTHFG